MKLSALLVGVRKITSSIPRSNFAEEDIEKAAELILAVEGLVNPIVLRRTSLESFEVFDGHFEYYAATRAREIDLRKGEMINAFILDADNEEILQQQVELLRKPKEIVTQDVSANMSHLESRFSNLEMRLEAKFNELQEQYKKVEAKLEKRITEVESKLPEKIELLKGFNEWDENELTSQLKKVYGNKQLSDRAQAIINGRPFKSLSDITGKVKFKQGNKNTAVITDKKMIELMDKCSSF